MSSQIEIVINEQSSAYLTCRFYDKDGQPATPTTINYRVDCATTGTAVRASTPVTPAAAITIALDRTDTTIQTTTNDYEQKIVTVEASYGGTDELNDEFRFRVKNLAKVT